ncbi:Hypothetical protein CINCED_3A001200 [Cinara cedri]|uniref:Uncharacterized protein n=1 Tax=Cinara cedri TaxID=506608 RepID=A0A5E4MRY6_9HEMI|nr:Hypothetical protein CINCED_3A001200 [Cinara cedri]
MSPFPKIGDVGYLEASVKGGYTVLESKVVRRMVSLGNTRRSGLDFTPGGNHCPFHQLPNPILHVMPAYQNQSKTGFCYSNYAWEPNRFINRILIKLIQVLFKRRKKRYSDKRSSVPQTLKTFDRQMGSDVISHSNH